MNAGVAQRDAFLRIANGQPAGPRFFQRAGDFNRAMAVGIGFDDRHHLDVHADGLSDRLKVGGDLAAGDFDPGAIGQGPRASEIDRRRPGVRAGVKRKGFVHRSEANSSKNDS